jgi:hypothetical protein
LSALQILFFPERQVQKIFSWCEEEVEEVGIKCIQGCLFKGDRHNQVFAAVIR